MEPTQTADPEIQELKQELEELREVTEDTNKVVHKMRRGIWWGRLWTIAMWLIFFGASGAAYYYYLGPVVTRAEQYYASWQQSSQAQGFGQAVQFFSDLFKNPQQSPTVPSGQ